VLELEPALEPALEPRLEAMVERAATERPGLVLPGVGRPAGPAALVWSAEP